MSELSQRERERCWTDGTGWEIRAALLTVTLTRLGSVHTLYSVSSLYLTCLSFFPFSILLAFFIAWTSVCHYRKDAQQRCAAVPRAPLQRRSVDFWIYMAPGSHKDSRWLSACCSRDQRGTHCILIEEERGLASVLLRTHTHIHTLLEHFVSIHLSTSTHCIAHWTFPWASFFISSKSARKRM